MLSPDQHHDLKSLLFSLERAEAESNAEFRVAYKSLGDYCIREFGEQFWDDETIHSLRSMVGLN